MDEEVNMTKRQCRALERRHILRRKKRRKRLAECDSGKTAAKPYAMLRKVELLELHDAGIVIVHEMKKRGHYRLNGYLDYWPNTGTTYNTENGWKKVVKLSIAEALHVDEELKRRIIIRAADKADYNNHLGSLYWRELRKRLIKERGAQCEDCKVAPTHLKNLHLHHKTYFRFGEEHDEDVVLICDDCHYTIHRKRRRRSNR